MYILILIKQYVSLLTHTCDVYKKKKNKRKYRKDKKTNVHVILKKD